MPMKIPTQRAIKMCHHVKLSSKKVVSLVHPGHDARISHLNMFTQYISLILNMHT
jgi:hypothetical protein